MGEFLLSGHVSYAVGRRYKWIAEFGKNTCDKCKALNGQEFEEGDVPFWPHPNCRCKVEEISIVDSVDSEYNEYKEEIEQLMLQAVELTGDAALLREQIEKTIREAQVQELKDEANTLSNKLERVEYEISRLILQIDQQTRESITRFIVEKLQRKIDKYKKETNDCAGECKELNAKLTAEKFIVDKSVDALGTPLAAEDAAAIWVLASSKFTRGLEYIEKNGKLVNKISDLNNKNLEEDVRKKLNSQIQKKEARGVHFHQNSSISKSVADSLKFKDIIRQKKEQLIYNKEVIGKISAFLNSNVNTFFALHGCDIMNVRVENGFLYATVLDTVDYNANDWKVILPRDLQEAGAIENYYILIEIVEPVSKYFKF